MIQCSVILYIFGSLDYTTPPNCLCDDPCIIEHTFQGTSTQPLQVRVKPKCGRLAGFSAGKENLHGVTAVTKGRRCAVALRFTPDPEHKELIFETVYCSNLTGESKLATNFSYH